MWPQITPSASCRRAIVASVLSYSVTNLTADLALDFKNAASDQYPNPSTRRSRFKYKLKSRIQL